MSLCAYRITYRRDDALDYMHIYSFSAQNAVDDFRRLFAPPDTEIVEVAKIVSNWK